MHLDSSAIDAQSVTEEQMRTAFVGDLPELRGFSGVSANDPA